MVAACKVYSVSMTRISVSTVMTLIQVTAGSTVPIELLRCMVAQTGSTTSTQLPFQINRKSVAATGGLAYTPKKLGPTTDPAASATAKIADAGSPFTVEGTDTDILAQGVFNYVGEGGLWLPSANERIFVDPTGIICLKFPVAPGAAITVTADMVFRQMG